MNLKKRISVILLLTLCFTVITSCASKATEIVPGNKEKLIANIYIEYLNIADIYFNLEKYDKAAENYKLALNNKDIYWDAYYKLAKTYVYQSKWSNAADSYKEILKRDPENSTLKASLAYIYSMDNQIEQAISLYEELLEVQSTDKAYLENYLSLLIIKKDSDKSEEILEKYQDLFPESTNLEKFTDAVNSIKLNEETSESTNNSETENKESEPENSNNMDLNTGSEK